jgi:hypothetical protein
VKGNKRGGEGEGDTVTDFNEAEEGDIATPDCENV